MEKKQRKRRIPILLRIIPIVLLITGGAAFLALNADNSAHSSSGDTQGIRYEPNTTAIKGGSVSSDANAGTNAGNRIPLHYAAGATSSDGENFACTLGNPRGAAYDIYFDIYADDAFTEEIYLSGLVAPGTQIESFKSGRKFPEGMTDVLVVITTVDDDHETLLTQTTVVLTLIVG